MSIIQDVELTIESYAREAQSWAEAHNDPDFWRNEFLDFQECLPSGTIIEIGCGGGRDAQLLIGVGYGYLGTDPVEDFIQFARSQNPGAEFEVQRAEELDYPEDRFDGFWASAVLLHIPKEGIDQVLGNLRRVVRNGGIGFIAIKEGDGEEIKDEVSSDGKHYQRFWAFYSNEEFQEVLKRNNMKVLKFMYRPISERTKWLVYIVEVQK